MKRLCVWQWCMIGLYRQKPLQNSQSGQRPPLIATAGHPQGCSVTYHTTSSSAEVTRPLPPTAVQLQGKAALGLRSCIKSIQTTRSISDHYLRTVFMSMSNDLLMRMALSSSDIHCLGQEISSLTFSVIFTKGCYSETRRSLAARHLRHPTRQPTNPLRLDRIRTIS
mgnify:FL=1